MTTDLLSLSDARALGVLIDAVDDGARVTIFPDLDNVTHYITGTLRHFVKSPDSFYLLDKFDDVRDCYVRVSAGFEHTFAVRDIIEWIKARTGQFEVI